MYCMQGCVDLPRSGPQWVWWVDIHTYNLHYGVDLHGGYRADAWKKMHIQRTTRRPVFDTIIN